MKSTSYCIDNNNTNKTKMTIQMAALPQQQQCCCSACEGFVSMRAHTTKYVGSTFGFHRNPSLLRQSLLDELVGPLIGFTNA